MFENRSYRVKHWVSRSNLLKKTCVRSRRHIFRPVLVEFGQNVCLNEVSDDFENRSCLQKKTKKKQVIMSNLFKNLMYALEVTYFSPILMKLDQNGCLNAVSEEFENGSCSVKH